MTRFISGILVCAFLLTCGSAAQCAAFEEHLWEKYTDIDTSSVRNAGGLAGVYLEPHQLADITTKQPFADLRVVTDKREEVPWQIILTKPEKRTEAISARVRNLSQTEKGETWLELLIDKENVHCNAVEIITSDTDFSRQVEVLGSTDGKTWNTLRKDGVIFDINRGEKLRHTQITFPRSSFRHLALKIVNDVARPLSISEVKVLQESDSKGQTYAVHGTIEKPETNASRKESSIIVRMNKVFPLDRLVIATAERNFQRAVEVQIKRGAGDWERWAQGTIFNFNTTTIHESQLAIDIPEIAAKEFRLIFKNLDSPSLSVTNVRGEGYRRLLVFKVEADQKLYLFWGNPLAQQPLYDLSGLISKQKPDELPIVVLGQPHTNTKFAGSSARLPFTERYKYLLYAVVTLAIAGLIFLQYRVFRRVQ